MNNYLKSKSEEFASHPLGKLFRQAIPEYIKSLPGIDVQYKVQGSVGQGNWANVPWIAILDKRLTKSIQQGEYIVYLFAEDMSSVYLTLNQGVTVPLREGKKKAFTYFAEKVQQMRELLPLKNMQKDENIELTTSGIGRDYQVSTVAYIRYDRGQVPDDDRLLADLQNVLSNYRLYADHVGHNSHEHFSDDSAEPDEDVHVDEEDTVLLDTIPVADRVASIKAYIQKKGFHFTEGLIENFYLSLKTKPFVILAGVSGTGKTKLVKLFAEAVGATSSNKQFTLVPVRPDWSDPSDLLGYKDLTGVYRPGLVTKVLVEASKPSNQNKPFFICLDEMNLARVEHYFSDMLSIMETQEWRQDRIVTAPLVQDNGLNEADREVYGNLSLPDNVYLIGTVNMDETTHPFSKKVLDRANTIEFNYINLEQFPETDQRANEDKGDPFPTYNSLLRSDYLQLADCYREYEELVHKVTSKLVKINSILEPIHSHVGFRIRDAVCFYMIYNERFALLRENEAFDLQLLQKLLPRVQGSSSSVKRVLLLLMQEAVGKSLPIRDAIDDASEIYTRWLSDDQDREDALYPLTARKIAFMLRRLEEDGFTSYWLS